jgi:hypothetical protein
MMGNLADSGWSAAITEAIVPDSMIGKMGSSHEGMKLVSLYVWEQNKKEYWKEARQKAKKV